MSSKKARPCNLDWIRSITRQCRDANVRCFVKQVGSRPYAGVGELETWPSSKMDSSHGLHLADRKGGDPSEWPEDLRVREWPQ